MKNIKLSLTELNQVKVLTRQQMKKMVGGLEESGNILCYCDNPILENGQYGIQWIADTFATAHIAGHI